MKREQLPLAKDEMELLALYRKAKSLLYAEIEIGIAEGSRVRLWMTEKDAPRRKSNGKNERGVGR